MRIKIIINEEIIDWSNTKLFEIRSQEMYGKH